MKSGDLTRQLIDDALAIEAQQAKDAGALGYMARALVQATLPHSKPTENEFERRNGAFTLVMMAPSRIGLPYGVVPRLLLTWVSTEAVRTKTRELVLGDNLTNFMQQLDMVPTGGRWGSITRLREQSKRLFSTNISCIYEGEDHSGEAGFRVADNHLLWWNPQNPTQRSLFQSTVTLSEAFFREVVEHPVPLDMRALKALKKSPLAIALYIWLTYRLSYLRRSTSIPWEALQLQFGAGYPSSAQGKADFKRKFAQALKKVEVIYRGLRGNVSMDTNHLTLIPAQSHISRRG
jgi:hypothetical protein